jgi:hypothetical protein
MDQESSQNQTLQQELQDIGGRFTHDMLFREVFEWLGVAKAFLRLVLSAPILAKLDLDRLTIEPRDFLSLIFKETRADVIYKLPILNSEESLRIYVLLEHKSFNDFFAVFQADQYAGQISQKEYQKADDDGRLNNDFRLSPVLVIIFHHGDSAFTGPTDVVDVYNDHGILGDYLSHRRAILFDLSTLSELELPDDPDSPELFAVLRVMQVIFSLDISTKVKEVLERLEPYSKIPKYHRLIRILWWYFVKNARKESRQGVMTVTEAVKKMIGENEMSMVLEMLKAEGKAEGKAEQGKGTLLKILRAKFKRVPRDVENAIHKMTDPVALDSWAVHAATCESMNEFAEAIR